MRSAIFFTVSFEYFIYAAIQAVTALSMTPPSVDVHIFVEGLRAEEALTLTEGLSKRLFVHCNVLGDAIPDSVPTTKQFPRVVYGRLFAPGLLDYDRLLYLDADIMITQPLTELFQLPMHGKSIAAVHDAGAIAGRLTHVRRKADTEAPLSDYFNAGMLLIDADRWRQNDFAHEVAAYTKFSGAGWKFHDQDLLNYVFEDDWLHLSPRWNCQAPFFESGLLDAIKPAILHFTGSVKPWNTESQFGAAFRLAAKRSGLPVDIKTTNLFTPMQALRMAVRRALYSTGISTRKARMQLQRWSTTRDSLANFLIEKQGIFADAFTPGEISKARPLFDGRTFRSPLLPQ